MYIYAFHTSMYESHNFVAHVFWLIIRTEASFFNKIFSSWEWNRASASVLITNYDISKYRLENLKSNLKVFFRN